MILDKMKNHVRCKRRHPQYELEAGVESTSILLGLSQVPNLRSLRSKLVEVLNVSDEMKNLEVDVPIALQNLGRATRRYSR